MQRLVLPAAFMLLALFFASSLVHAEERDRRWYREHGVTVVAQEKASPLSFIGYDGAPKGFVVDVWDAWSRKTGIAVTFRMAEWSDTLRLVASGECDIHSGLFYNEERDAVLDFSLPYSRMRAALMVLKKNDASVDDIFRSYPIGVLHKGYSEFYMRSTHPQSAIKPYENGYQLAKALSDGDIKAVVGDHPVLGYEAGKLGLAKELVVKKILYEQALRGAVAQGNETLLAIVDEGFSAISKDEWDSIRERWFVEDDSSTDWMWHVAILGGIFVAAVLILLIIDRRRPDKLSFGD